MYVKSFIFIGYFLFISSLQALSPQEVKKELIKSQKELKSVIRIFSQTVAFSIPTKPFYKPVFKKQQRGHFIIEFVPEGQSLKKWTDMYTLQGFQGFARKNMNAMKMMDMLKYNFKKRFSDRIHFQELYRRDLAGDKGIMFVVGIPASKALDLPGYLRKRGEVALYIVIKGKEDIYLIHRSWKADIKLGELLPVDKKEFEYWMELLKKVSLV